MADKDDWELQKAIALSLAEASQPLPPPPPQQQQQQGGSLSGAAAKGQASGTPGSSKRSPPAGEEPEDAAAGGKGKGKRQRKGPKAASFNPTAAEAAACFQQLSSGGRVTRYSLLSAARTLALDIDDSKAVLMMEVAQQAALGRSGSGSGQPSSLTAAEFQKVVDHFTVP